MASRIRRVLYIVAALAVVGVVGAQPIAHADQVGGLIRVHQYFNTSNPAANDTFEYCLEAHTANAPMPEGAQGNKHCFTMTGNDTHEIQLQAHASAPFKSEYSLYMKTQLPEGYQQSDPTEYHHEVYYNGKDFAVLAFNEDGTSKVEDPVFTVMYKATPTTTPPTTTPPTTTPPTTTPPSETPSDPGTPTTPVKPPTGNLVQTGATVTFGAMLVLLVVGGLLLSRRREAE